VSTRGDFKGAAWGCGFALFIWAFVLFGILVVGFQLSSNKPGLVVWILLAVLGIPWTVLAIKWFAPMGNPHLYEKERWKRQEATRLRKKAWKEGKR
jgi:hypothetical protein